MSWAGYHVFNKRSELTFASVHMSQIRDNIDRVRERIASAAKRSGRNPEQITLIAVTKTIAVARMREAADAGVTEFGENYYQEIKEKLADFSGSIHWHFIGHLQSNKARYLVGRVSIIHSVDSVHLAEEIARRASSAGLVQPILLEVKLDPAETKYGISLDRCLETADTISRLKGIDLQGLMGMAPYGSAPELARPYFQSLRGQFDSLPPAQRRVLSMGMTADFETAIEEGATHVRIGTAIFGSRNP